MIYLECTGTTLGSFRKAFLFAETSKHCKRVFIRDRLTALLQNCKHVINSNQHLQILFERNVIVFPWQTHTLRHTTTDFGKVYMNTIYS